ncbi:YDG domain-containing protein, partial [Sphingomonas sp. CROZ-RG-20F-R02-07]|uniref:beta strand repeat-containing protein n=1 Tax=Sphingomonas sp. CROZ-RG-20F-R02-07 TaxID=2914832 RepID=UPI001F5672FF
MILDTPARAFSVMARTSFRACTSFALIHLLATTPAAAQSIAGPQVSAGAASVAGVGTTNVVVTQTTDKAVIDWRAFSVDNGTSVAFRQPGAGSIALNRITGSGQTRIDGSLVANGQVWLLNPNGVLIGAGGQVNAAGFLASTHAMSNADFLGGNYTLTGDGSAAGVTNLGAIVAADGGYAVLAGNHVANAGLVQARLGTVALGAGKTMVLDVVGDKLLSFAVTAPLSVVATGGALVDNAGTLSAKGGQVLMTARAAAGVVSGVVNTTGLIDATAVSRQGGTIVLDGGDTGLVYAAGTLDASGKGAGQTGGSIGVFGDTVVAGAGATLDASGYAGGGTIAVGGGWQGASVGGHASAVRAGLAASATLDASALSTGDGGTVTVWSDVTNATSQTLAYGTILARGGAGGGNGGRIETSGHYLDTTGVRGSAAAPFGAAGLWLFDPYDVEIVAAGTGNAPAIVNPGFESGLTGWTALPNSTTATQVVVSATGDSATGNSGATFTSQVSSGGHFALASGGTASVANGIQQTFVGAAGQYFDLYALFLGKDYTPYNDSGTVQLVQPNGQVLTLYSQAISNGNNYLTVPWQQQRVTLAQNGTYTIKAYSTNIGDAGSPSQLGFELATGSGGSSNGAFATTSGGQTWTPTATASKVDVSQITGFLNAGTNVQITTGTANQGSEAGNITVNAMIAKTAGAAATLRLDAANAIVVNQTIGSTSNALNLVLNAGAGGIALNAGVGTNGGSLALSTTGAATQTAALTAGALTLNGTGGSYTLTNAANVFQTLGGNTGTIAIANAAAATTLAALTTTGTLAITTAGTVTQTSALTAPTLSLSGGSYTLTNAANAVGTLTGTAAAATLIDGAAVTVTGFASTGAFALTGGGAVTLAGNDGFGADASVSSPGAITLASGARLTSAGTLALRAGTNFTNQAGASAIATTGSGRWLIYSQAPSGDQFGGLASGNAALLGRAAGATVTEAGNRYVFAVTPTITVTPAGTHKTYGDTLTAAGVPYAATGLIDASAYGNVFTQDVLSGAPGVDPSYGGLAATAYAGTYQLHATQGSLSAPQGYGFAFGAATLTVDPRTLVLAAVTDSRVYDGSTASAATPIVTGLVNGDTVSGAAQSFDSRNAGTRTLSVGAVTVNDGANGYNYTITRQTAGGSITAKALTASLTGGVAKTYDGTTAATLAGGNYTLAGTVTGDAVALNAPTSGSFDTKNVGTAKTVSVGNLALSGSDAG